MRALQAFVSASFCVFVVAIRRPIVFAIYVGKSAQLLKFRDVEFGASLLLDLGGRIVNSTVVGRLPPRAATHPTARVAGGNALRLPAPPVAALQEDLLAALPRGARPGSARASLVLLS